MSNDGAKSANRTNVGNASPKRDMNRSSFHSFGKGIEHKLPAPRPVNCKDADRVDLRVAI